MKYFSNQRIWGLKSKYICKANVTATDPCLKCDFLGLNTENCFFGCCSSRFIARVCDWNKSFKEIFYA